MTKTPDYTAMFKDMMGKFPVDMSAFEDAYKAQAAFGEKNVRRCFGSCDEICRDFFCLDKSFFGKSC